MSNATLAKKNHRGTHERCDDVPAWLAAQPINADLTPTAIDCRGRRLIRFQIVIAATSDPIGNLYFQSSEDNSTFTAVKIVEGKMYTNDATAITHTSADLTKIVVNDPAASASILVSFENPGSFMRFFYDATSGGSATGLAASYTLQG